MKIISSMLGFLLALTILPVCGAVVYRAQIAPVDDKGGVSGCGVVTLWPAAIGKQTVGWRVLNSVGEEVSHQVIWQAAAEPVCLTFDNRGGGQFQVEALDAENTHNSGWTMRHGLTVETRRLPAGSATAESWDEASQLWQNGTPVGRYFTSQIFSGLPPHSVGTFAAIRYQGYFDVAEAGQYAFATASGDASFLAVNETRVAAWPGQHGPGAGVRGKYSGLITLKKGRHFIDYLNIVADSGFSVLCAWRKPGEDLFVVMPAAAFSQCDKYKLQNVTATQAVAPVIVWQGGGFVADMVTTIHRVYFSAPGARDDDEVRWRFDDGVRDISGKRVTHHFLGERVRSVWCEVWRDGKCIQKMEQQLRLRRQPIQRELNPAAELRQFLRALADAQGLRQRNIAELPQLFRVADNASHPALAAIAAALWERRQECGVDLYQALYDLGFYYQRPQVRAPERVEGTWQTILANDACGAPLRARTALHLAGFLIHSGRDVARGLTLLETTASDEVLDSGEQRLKTIFRGDGLILGGDRVGALSAYRAAGLTVGDDDTNYEVRRRARLEAARQFLEKGELEAAERLLRELEWERPLERLNLETGMLLMELHLARNEPDLALIVGRRLLVGAPADPERPELLLKLATINFTMGDGAAAVTLLRQLQRDFPYSAAAAVAADRYPDLK